MIGSNVLIFGALTAVLLSGQTDWPMFGHDSGAARFSPLKQIDTSNVDHLQRAWTFHTGKPGSEGILIVVNDVMYVTAANGIFLRSSRKRANRYGITKRFRSPYAGWLTGPVIAPCIPVSLRA